MFSRKVCHVFVRPKRKVLEVCIFLGRALRDPRVRRADRSSKVKFANLVHLTHRDEVEPPFTDWLREAYELQDAIGVAKPPRRGKDGEGRHREGREARQGGENRENDHTGKDGAGCKTACRPSSAVIGRRAGAAIRSVATLGRR